MTAGAPATDEVTDRAAGHRWADDVEVLAARVGTAPPPSALPPAAAAWFAHRPHRDPLVVRAHDGADLTGVVVLARRRRSGVVLVEPAGEPGEPWDALLASPVHADALAEALVDDLGATGEPWVLRLTGLPADSAFAAALTTRLPHLAVEPGPVAPRLHVATALPDTAVLTRNTRSAVGRAANRLAADGRSLTSRWLHEPDDVDGVLDAVTAVRAARNAHREHAPAPDPVEIATFRDTVVGHAAHGRARLLVTYVDGELAAFAVGVVTGDVVWVYANAVNPEHLRYSAGALTNVELVRWAHRDPTLHWVDWGPGLQRYKQSGPVTLRPSTTLTAWSSRGLRWAHGLARSGRRLRPGR